MMPVNGFPVWIGKVPQKAQVQNRGGPVSAQENCEIILRNLAAFSTNEITNASAAMADIGRLARDMHRVGTGYRARAYCGRSTRPPRHTPSGTIMGDMPQCQTV